MVLRGYNLPRAQSMVKLESMFALSGCKMSESSVDLPKIHNAFISFNKRAERTSDSILVDTFVDSAPLFTLLSTQNNQVLCGRRGTGKTHALKYLSEHIIERGDSSIYIDLRTCGSNGAIYADTTKTLAERAGTLLTDVMGALLHEFYNIALKQIDNGADGHQVTMRLDDFSNAITAIKVAGTVESEATTALADKFDRETTGVLKLSQSPSIDFAAKIARQGSRSDTMKRKESGIEKISINFGSINACLVGLIKALAVKRIWILIDEWSEVPLELQPYLADLIRRTILPVNEITVKIAAIEHRSNFSLLKERGEYIGIELGADVAADLNLDDFLVFDNNQEKSISFFKSLIFKHYQESEGYDETVESPDKLISVCFTQGPVFDEFVRAVEGVPRDALNLAAKIATKAYGQKIAMQNVRDAARDWYQQDKSAVIRNNEKLSSLLNKIVDDVIGNRRARAFLFPSNKRNDEIEQLFDSRLLHILKKNVSSKDQPGIRYDVYKIDYGCYVELMNTNKAPTALIIVDEDEAIDVPKDDYRSIRRAILDLEI